MDLRQLAALTAVADHHSFSAAARALHTVQSNVSTHIAHLERELSASLVDRASGTLTEAGELVVARARRIQAELEALTADVASSLGDISGGVRLGMIGTTGRWLTPEFLGAMTGAHPKVRVVLVDATTTSLIPQLAAGGLDLAVVNLPVSHPDIAAEPLFEEDHVLVVPDGHALSDRDTVDIAELASHELLLEPCGTGFRDDLEADADRGRHPAPRTGRDRRHATARITRVPRFRGRAPSGERRAFGRDRRAVATDSCHRMHSAIGRPSGAPACPPQRPRTRDTRRSRRRRPPGGSAQSGAAGGAGARRDR